MIKKSHGSRERAWLFATAIVFLLGFAMNTGWAGSRVSDEDIERIVGEIATAIFEAILLIENNYMLCLLCGYSGMLG